MVGPTWLHNLRDYSAQENLEIVMNEASEARLSLRRIPVMVMENAFYVTDSTVTLEHEMVVLACQCGEQGKDRAVFFPEYDWRVFGCGRFNAISL